MTLIVGIKCEDGVVLGADGAATFGPPMGQTTIRQATSKLQVISNRVALGVSGPVGLGQSYKQEIEDYLSSKGGLKTTWKNVAQAKDWLRAAMWKHAKPAWENASVIAKTAGGAAASTAMHASVVAFPIEGEAHLVQFDHQCQPEEATRDLPFIAIGSGQAIGDPFLAFLRRVFWQTDLPSLNDGIFAAVWTLQHAVESHPGGVAEPIEIVTLQKAGANWRVDKLEGSALGEHRQMIVTLQNEMREFCKTVFQAAPNQPIPKKP